jgi:hypothetical protein
MEMNRAEFWHDFQSGWIRELYSFVPILNIRALAGCLSKCSVIELGNKGTHLEMTVLGTGIDRKHRSGATKFFYSGGC